MNTDKAFIELSRGTYRATVCGIELDVWQTGGLGWKYNAFDPAKRVYLGYDIGFSSLENACEAAIRFAETYK